MKNLIDTFQKIKLSNTRLDYQYRREALYRLNLAQALMLREQGFLNDEEYHAIFDGLNQIQDKVKASDVELSEGDIHFLYEKALFEVIDRKIASKLHTGRSRNDMYFTMYRMSLRDAIWLTIDELLKTQQLLQVQAKEHLETVIPYYTYGQPSQPGTWGHYLLSVQEMFHADVKRLRNAYETVNRCAMGSAAGIGTAFNLNKIRMAELLGFDGVIDNTVVGNSSVDYFLETISALAILNTTLSRVSSDFVFFSTAECSILDCDRSICGSSSIMPQKKNAAAAELLRSETEHFNGYMLSAFSAASSTSLFPVHETYLFFERFWDNVKTLVDNIRLLRLILERSAINRQRGFDLALDGFTAATGMAEELSVQEHLPFTLTHHVVGGMIRTLMDENRLKVNQMSSDLLKRESKKVLGVPIFRTSEQIQAMMDPLNSLKAKVTGGTPKPEDGLKLLESGQQRIVEDENWLVVVKKQVEDAYAKIVGTNSPVFNICYRDGD